MCRAVKSLPQAVNPQKLPQLNRREFLAAMGNLSALTIAHEKAMNLLGLTDPYPDTERTAIINRWIAKVNETVVQLEALSTYLHRIRALPPSEVDGHQALKMMWDSLDSGNSLCHLIEAGETEAGYNIDEFIRIASGEPIYLVCIKDEILRGFKAETIQLEINAVRKDDPKAADELQALLDARGGAS